MILLIAATAAVCILFATRVWIHTRDIYHPMLLFTPVLLFFYVVQPILLLASIRRDDFFSQEQLLQIQGVSLVGVIALAAGASETRVPFRKRTPDAPVSPRQFDRLRGVVVVIGCIGFLLWIKTLANVGGFQSAFSQAYGGGWDDSGYIREFSLQCPFIAVLLMSYLAGKTSATPSNLLLLTAFGFPLLAQALLGARRGPTFMLVVICACAFHLGRGSRPRLTRGVLFGTLIAALLLLLITNRDSIYIGSKQSIDPGRITSYFDIGPGTEYLVGGAEILHTWDTGHVAWGRNWLAEVFVRPIPHEVWPTKWEDWASWTGSAVIGAAFHAADSETTGWDVAVGTPPGIIAETFAEWSWLSIVALWWIGRLYAKCWVKARSRKGNWPVYYSACAALTIYVTAQGPLDTIYRFILLIGILALILRIAQPSTLNTVRPTYPHREYALTHSVSHRSRSVSVL